MKETTSKSNSCTTFPNWKVTPNTKYEKTQTSNNQVDEPINNKVV